MRDEFQRGDTGKLNTPRTSDLSLGSPKGSDEVSLSAWVRAEQGSAVDADAAKRLGDIYAEIARSKVLLEDLQGPMFALRLALGLLAGEVPEAQLFAGCSADEKDYVRALALHLVDATQFRQRVEVAVAQFNAAAEQMAALEKAVEQAAVSAQTIGTEAFRDLRIEKIRGLVHPLAMLHVTFEGDEMLSALVPPPRKTETRKLVAPDDGLPQASGTRPLTGPLTDALANVLNNPQDVAKAARRFVRRAVRALLYPPPPSGK
ncbi:MAG: hypothetical protein FJZ01_00910 [Candidatus Sericytochromatia bacterium]|nr:hypothetical protein [Candidatus Tanganyikabacteria bacterium]